MYDVAVLVAISIPIFTTQLEKAREATDASNIRAAYAEVMAEALTNNQTPVSRTVILTQKQDEWQTSNLDIATGKIDNEGDNKSTSVTLTVATGSKPKAGGKATITYTPAKNDGTAATVVLSYSE